MVTWPFDVIFTINLIVEKFEIYQISFLGGELLAWVICQDLSSLSLWEYSLLICNSCPILVLRLVNIASCDQNVWQMQKTSLQSLFNLDIKSEIYPPPRQLDATVMKVSESYVSVRSYILLCRVSTTPIKLKMI